MKIKGNSIFLILLLLVMTGCDNIETIDTQEFVKRAERMNETHSAHWTIFLGVKGGKAYLEEGSLATITGNPKIEIYCTDYAELPGEIKKMIEDRESPWVPKEPKQND